MNMKSAIGMITSHRPGSRLILAALALLIAVSASVADSGAALGQSPPDVTVMFGAATYSSRMRGLRARCIADIDGGAAAGGDDPDRGTCTFLGATSADYSTSPSSLTSVTFGAAETSRSFTFKATLDNPSDDNEKVTFRHRVGAAFGGHCAHSELRTVVTIRNAERADPTRLPPHR